jgi:hypothetical protein
LAKSLAIVVIPALLLALSSCNLSPSSGDNTPAAAAFARCVREFSSTTPGASTDEADLYADITALLRDPEGPGYLRRLDLAFPLIVYSETAGVVYFLVHDRAWKYTLLMCLGDVDRSDFANAWCGSDPIYDLGRFHSDRITNEGEAVAVRFFAPQNPEYCKTYGLEPGGRYIARVRMGQAPVWPVPVIRD